MSIINTMQYNVCVHKYTMSNIFSEMQIYDYCKWYDSIILIYSVKYTNTIYFTNAIQCVNAMQCDYSIYVLLLLCSIISVCVILFCLCNANTLLIFYCVYCDLCVNVCVCSTILM